MESYSWCLDIQSNGTLQNDTLLRDIQFDDSLLHDDNQLYGT